MIEKETIKSCRNYQELDFSHQEVEQQSDIGPLKKEAKVRQSLEQQQISTKIKNSAMKQLKRLDSPKQTLQSVQRFSVPNQSRISQNRDPDLIIKQFQSYEPHNGEAFDISQLHSSPNLKLKRYRQSTYYGQFLNGKRQGMGIMLYDNERLYQGQWEEDLKSGQGFQRFPNDCSYEGQYLQGKPDGVGRYVWKNGEVYDGQWKNGLKHGSGMWQGSKGDSYIGEWKEGKAEGYGVHTWVNGDRYEGQFKECLKHGEGIQKFANGDIYKGNYENGKPSGYGQYFWANRSYFKGQFKNGLRDGQGLWKKGPGNCDKYQGHYINDKKSGSGIFTWASGNIYKGNYDSDQRHGYGQMYWADDSFYKGMWHKGIQHGKGEMYEPEHGFKIGMFQDNVLVSIDKESEEAYYAHKNDQNDDGLGQNDWKPGNILQKQTSQPLPSDKLLLRTRAFSGNYKSRDIKSQSRSDYQSIRSDNSSFVNVKNCHNPIIKARFVKSRPKFLDNMRNMKSIQDKKTIEQKKIKQKVLHSSFYLHKLHNRSNNLKKASGKLSVATNKTVDHKPNYESQNMEEQLRYHREETNKKPLNGIPKGKIRSVHGYRRL